MSDSEKVADRPLTVGGSNGSTAVTEADASATTYDPAVAAAGVAPADEAAVPARASRALAEEVTESLAGTVSGLYEWSSEAAPPSGDASDTLRETLRLDVDGHFPQMVVSGTIYGFLVERVHWIAQLDAQAADGSWTGQVWQRFGDTARFPWQQVRVTAQQSGTPGSRSATVTFSGGAAAPFTRTYRGSSPYFHPCEIEYDVVDGATAVTSIRTHDHPNRPASLPDEELSIATVYRRAGFDVTRGADNPIPIAPNTAGGWNSAELHDAMQVFWSRFADRPQWAVWTLFASVSEWGSGIGGIMFDDVGPTQRQGTAVFTDSFIKNAPAGDAAPTAWVKRMRFWCAVHELGHTFNLAHPFERVHPDTSGSGWIPLVNDPEERTFMNYPQLVSGRQAAFFASFEYRFSDQELLFMRHAPERFVQQGSAAWYTNHAFEQLRTRRSPAFALELRSNQGEAEKSTSVTLPFLDQVVVELKLTNVTDEVRRVDERVLDSLDRMTIVVQRAGGVARLWAPHATTCWHAHERELGPGESTYASLYLSAGRHGFYVDEPGRYVVQAALHLEEEDVVSNPFHLRVLPPRGYEEEKFAQDLFVSDVGRVLAFDGTQELIAANDVLRQAVTEFPKHPLATHARVALGLPRVREFRALRADDGPRRLRFDVHAPDMGEARQFLQQALADAPAQAARTLGHKDFAEYGASFARALEANGDPSGAEAERQTVIDGLRDRGVRKAILDDVDRSMRTAR